MDTFTFCFKGDRTYVHGTDLYNSICEYLEERCSGSMPAIDLWIRKVVTHNMEGCVLDEDEDEATPSPPAVLCRFESGGRAQKLCLFEQESLVTCRYAYDEERIVRAAELLLEAKRIRLTEHLPFTLVELAVAMNKELVGQLFRPAEGKWYFTRLNLERPLPTDYSSHVTVSFEASSGSRLTRSSIIVDGLAYGHIFFSLVRGH